MAIQTANIPPDNVVVLPRLLQAEWGAGLSAAIQAAGLAKSQLEGFNIFSRISKTWAQATSGAASPSFVIPVNVKTNDFMLVQVTTVSGTTITTPSGWTIIRTDVASGGTGPVTQSLYFRYAAGTAGQLSTDGGTTVTFTLSNTATATAASLLVYGGVALSSAVNVQGSASSSVNGTTATAGALTTTVANAYVIQLIGADAALATQTFSTPATYTARASNGQAGWQQTNEVVTSAAFDVPQPVAGTTGTPAITLGTTGSWVVQTIALTPAISGANAFVPTATAVAGGSLTVSTTYYYRVSAVSGSNNGTGVTLPCVEVSAATAGANLSVQLAWTAVPNAVGYQIFGRATGAELLIAQVAGSATTYTDTGAITPLGAMPTVDTSADSGQAIWGACPNYSATNTKYMYEVFQFTDSLQSTSPVFIRFDYGTGSSSASTPQMWMQVGTTTNGTGTPVPAPQFPLSSTTSILLFGTGIWQSTANSPYYVDSDGGASLMMAGWVNAAGSGTPASCGGVALVERSREWDGTPNGDGVACVWASASVLGSYQMLLITNSTLFTSSGSTTSSPTGQMISVAAGSPNLIATVGSTIYVFPFFLGVTPKMSGPSKHIVTAYLSDIASGASFTITHFGASHTFLKSNSPLPTGHMMCFRTA